MLDVELRAIADPRRRGILRLVNTRELTAGEIAAQFDVTRPAISQHLKLLVEAGLVTVRQQGTRRFYKARPEGLEGLRTFLAEFWSESLQLLKQEAEMEERRRSHEPN